MKHYFHPVIALATLALLVSISVQAGAGGKMVIALKTNDFELTETDISNLSIGEAKTIETGSGKVVDILRTADGAEIYVDGELLEMNLDEEGLHEQHMVKKYVEIDCDDDEAGTGCSDQMIWISDDGEIDIEKLHEEHQDGEGHKIVVIKKTRMTED